MKKDLHREEEHHDCSDDSCCPSNSNSCGCGDGGDEEETMENELIIIRGFILEGIKNLCYEKKEFTLVSGKKSDFYIDIRRISFDGNYLFHMGILLYEEILSLNPNGYKKGFPIIAGVPVGGLTLVSGVLCASFVDGNPFKSVVIRKEKKEYGHQNMIEPTQFLSAGTEILLLEDVVTTGGSILKAVENARNEGYNVKDAICIVDRKEGGAENLSKNGVTLHSLFSREDIES